MVISSIILIAGGNDYSIGYAYNGPTIHRFNRLEQPSWGFTFNPSQSEAWQKSKCMAMIIQHVSHIKSMTGAILDALRNIKCNILWNIHESTHPRFPKIYDGWSLHLKGSYPMITPEILSHPHMTHFRWVGCFFGMVGPRASSPSLPWRPLFTPGGLGGLPRGAGGPRSPSGREYVTYSRRNLEKWSKNTDLTDKTHGNYTGIEFWNPWGSLNGWCDEALAVLKMHQAEIVSPAKVVPKFKSSWPCPMRIVYVIVAARQQNQFQEQTIYRSYRCLRKKKQHTWNCPGTIWNSQFSWWSSPTWYFIISNGEWTSAKIKRCNLAVSWIWA